MIKHLSERVCSIVVALMVLGACSQQQNSSAQPVSGSGATAASIRDCADCPELVQIPAGEFTMGSPSSELYRGAETQHRVTIPAFDLGKDEVTFAQWDVCVSDGGCGGHRPDDQGWGRGTRPVIGVSWGDAKAYVAWLSRKTGKQYRLPSEAEWEYAARAGTTTPFSFGQTLTTDQANFDGTTGYGTGPAGLNRQKTMPVGSFPANAFGLHDMHGNVWEWMEDCWSDEYTADSPKTGAAYVQANCGGRVMRGGSWEDYPGDVRAAARVGSGKDEQSWADGFRVARSVD
jgi:formylglycine-generating enzyme required for sulfatase activity